MLIGLAAVAVPILIHLFHRRRAKVTDWGAMRFVLAALAARRQNIRLEEALLLALRCFLVALLAAAMARPFVPAHSAVPWPVVLPALLVAAVLGAVGVALWDSRRVRWALLGVGALLLLGAAAVTVWEYATQQQRWTGGSEGRDIAIVLDGSTSMTRAAGGGTAFDRAVEEARAVVAACRPGDAVSVLVAAETPRPVVATPSFEHERVAAELGAAAPAGGTLRVLRALSAAAESVRAGSNPAKKILLISDGQTVGWQVQDAAAWEFLAAALGEGEGPASARPEIVVRNLPAPDSFANVAVREIRLSRPVVGTDRPVAIRVTVENTGTGRVEPQAVELAIDGAAPRRQPVGALLAGGAETVEFHHHFRRPGRHLLAARVLCEDALGADDAAARVVCVRETLEVLLVDGAPSVRPLGGAAAYLELALAPPVGEAEEAARDNLIAVNVVPATRLGQEGDFGRYGVVALANVPLLPPDVAAALAAYVRDGGGLLLLPGDRAKPAFYNAWRTGAGVHVPPGGLGERRQLPEDRPARLAPPSFRLPGLQALAAAPQSHLDELEVRAYWTLEMDEGATATRVAARLNTADPFLADRRLGKGRVLMTALSLDARDTNPGAAGALVPLLHEMVYALAAGGQDGANVPPGAEAVIELPVREDAPSRGAAAARLDVRAPSGRTVPATATALGRTLRIRCRATDEPGVYRLILPASLSQRYDPGPAGADGVGFVVVPDPAESSLETLSEADLAAVSHILPVRAVHSVGELVSVVSGRVPGQELWRWLVLGALAALCGEVAVTRWIASRRRVHKAEAVRFGEGAVDLATFRRRARELLTVGSPETPAGQREGETVEVP